MGDLGFWALAHEHPGKLAELVELWWEEARSNDVLPLDNRVLHAINNPKPDWRPPRLVNRLYPGTAPVPESVLAQGSVLGGYSLQLWEGRLRYVHNLYGKELHVLEAAEPLAPGPHTLTYRFDRHEDSGGDTALLVDDAVVAQGHIRLFTVAAFNETNAGLTVGYELGPAVGPGYRAPFPSTAEIRSVTITLSEHIPINPMVEFERIMAEE